MIVYNAADNVYHSDAQRELFYTICTRAMHALQLFSLGPRSSLLRRVSKDSYNIQYPILKNANKGDKSE